jgi:transcription termination factor NusA
MLSLDRPETVSRRLEEDPPADRPAVRTRLGTIGMKQLSGSPAYPWPPRTKPRMKKEHDRMAATALEPGTDHAAAAVLEVAERLHSIGPEWLVFFREELGVDGIVRRTFNTPDALIRFECTPHYARIREMLDDLRERERERPAERATQRVVTVRMPRSLHETLKAEAEEMRVSINTLCISKLLKMLDEDERRVEVVVADDQFPLAIGRRGQNVRLASQLTGWQIDLITESADSERYQKEFQERTDLFMKALDADETLAQLLASEGFESVEEIAFVAPDDFITLEGFDKDVAEELQERAREFLERVAVENDNKRRELGVEDDVMELEGVTPAFAVKLGEQGVKTVEDVAGLVPDDITGYREPGPDGKPVWVEGILKKNEMRKDDAQMFIMKARVVAGWIEQEAVDALLVDQGGGEAPELTEEERALLALGELGNSVTDDDALAEELGFDLADLQQVEGGDEEAVPEQ